MPRRGRSVDASRLASTFTDARRISGSIRTVRPVLGYLAARGHDTAAMLQAEGVDPSLVDEPEARLPHAVMIRVWEAARRLTGDQVDDAYAENRLRTYLLAAFAAMALACLGIYGTLSYVVSLRRREVGLRVALGARSSNIAGQFLVKALRVVAIVAAVAVVAALIPAMRAARIDPMQTPREE